LNGPDGAVTDSAIDGHCVKKAQTRHEKCRPMDAVHKLLGPELCGILSLSVDKTLGYSGHCLFDSIDIICEKCTIVALLVPA
jgi:hypothetical protein